MHSDPSAAKRHRFRRASTNPILATFLPNFLAAERNLRQVIALVRQLRIAVAHHLGTSLELPDPLGAGALQLTTEDGVTRIRSAGERGGKPLERLVTRR